MAQNGATAIEMLDEITAARNALTVQGGTTEGGAYPPVSVVTLQPNAVAANQQF